MPRATITEGETKRFELKSCKGGWVELRHLTFAEMMQRRDIMARMYTEFETEGSGKKRTIKGEETVKQYMEMVNRATAEFEFSRCIMEHNLTDEEDNKLDFRNPMTLDILHPKIGAEIDGYIEEMNQEDEIEEKIDPLARPRTSSLPDGEKRQSETTIH